MKHLFTHPDLILVGHLRAVLEQNGIACHVKNEMLAGGIGELPAHECWPQLWVLDEADAARATALIEASVAASDAPVAGEPWTCPRCGERIEAQFSECWNCAGRGELEA